MSKQDIKEFQKLLTSDAEFQKKFRAAAEAFTGEQDEKVIFDNLLLPLAKEYGLSVTYEEFRECADALSGGSEFILSEDELEQVAGGNARKPICPVVVGL